MSRKSYEGQVARLIQELTVEELKKEVSYQYCLNLIAKHKLQHPETLTKEERALRVFDMYKEQFR